MISQPNFDRSAFASSQYAVRPVRFNQFMDKPIVSRGVESVEPVRFAEGSKSNQLFSLIHSFNDTNAAIKYQNLMASGQLLTSFYSAKMKYVMVSVQSKSQEHPNVNLFA